MSTEAGGDSSRARARKQVDPRGQRFSAAITTAVLLTALLLGGAGGVALVAWQWLCFAVAAAVGTQRGPYGLLFRLARRTLPIGPPETLELEAGPRFAQFCGMVVLTGALSAFAVGAEASGWVLVGIAAGLSTLLAALNVCVGCRLYGFLSRLDRAAPRGS